MPFGQSTPAVQPQAHTAPPPPPAGPGAGAPPPPAPVHAHDPVYWVSLNGVQTKVPLSQFGTLPPGTMAMPEDQSRPWAPKESYATPAPAQAAPAGFGGRTAAANPAAPGVPRGAFAGVENAQVYQRNANITPGDYVVEITEALYKNLRSGKNSVIIEGRVLVSSYNAANPNTLGCNKEGSDISVFVTQNDSFASNMKEIILALSGFDAAGNPRPLDDVVTSTECEALVAPEQAYTGRKVFLQAREITTKAGNPYTRVQWHPCPIDGQGKPDLVRLQQLYGVG